MSQRSTKLKQWLHDLGYRDFALTPASSDASFRAYLRLETASGSLIVMDAPPERESCDQFIRVAAKLRDAGLNAPEVFAAELEQGFLLLTDFGADDYLSQLTPESEAGLYADALAALSTMQERVETDGLPDYDTALLNSEMDLFHDWFLGELLGIELNPVQQDAWRSIKNTLVENALEQPRVFVHRDYHSRNLMRLARRNPGILDFQDAMFGPLTYDLVSLLRDCYVAWPPSRVEQLALEYRESALAAGLHDADAGQFLRWFDLMGAQRHLKAIGIFSRLRLRDGKPGYLGDIPRTLEYLYQVGEGQACLSGLLSLIEQTDLRRRAAGLAQR